MYIFEIIATVKPLTHPLLHTAAVSLYVVRTPEISPLSQVQVHSPAAPATDSHLDVRCSECLPSSCTPETGSPSVPTLSLLLQSLAATTLLSAFLSLIYLIPHTTKVMSLFCVWLLLLSTMPSTFGHAFIHGISPPFSRLHNIPQTIFSYSHLFIHCHTSPCHSYRE